MNSYDTYYPRPQLKRASFFSLNGKWKLNDQTINVPYPPEAELSGYKGPTEQLHYEKCFVLPADFYGSDDKVILHFGAVDQVCDVYLNDTFLTHHEGGYLPFSVDITSHLKKNNILKVDVTDTLDPFYPYGKQCKDPKGMWYTPVSGIWQSVWIEAYPQNGIDSIELTADADTLKIHIDSKADHFVIETEGYKETTDQKDITISFKDPHLWSPADPYLYKLNISTDNDSIESYFALRKISVREIDGQKKLFLNDEPLFINGLLDQGYFEPGIYVPEDPEDYEKDVVNIKELGFNTLRKHIKIEAEAFYHYCDLHGILVIQDMVNSGPYRFFKDTILPTIGFTHLKQKIKDQKRYDFFLEQAKETITHLKNHPCIIAYTIYNEGWGQQDASGTYEILKQCDPERLFDSTSGWFFDDKSDFDSYHIYFRNKVLNGGKNLLFLSECGGFIRNIAEHRSEKGSTWGYGKTDSEEELTGKIIDMHEKMVIPSIRNGLVGLIMTQISDVEGEVNGLFTYDRSICKVNKEKILEANRRLDRIYKEQF